jgi:hypothetical protein
MKKYTLYLCLMALAVSCGKDKFETVPQIRVLSTNTDILPIQGVLRVVLEVTDKEGDVTDSVIVVRERLNIKNPNVRPRINFPIPSFPASSRAEFQVDILHQDLVSGTNPAIPIPGTTRFEPDTMRLKFVVKDAAGNKSDTASVGVIVIR